MFALMKFNNVSHFSVFTGSWAGVFIFIYLTKIFFTKSVQKIANSIPLRIIAVINRVLIFRGLKRGLAGIFS